MFGIYRKPPAPDSTDEAARRILKLLQQEEREKQARRRIEAEGWRPPERSAPPAPERRFGDGRDDLVKMVQADLDQRQAPQDEARRRVQLSQADTGVPLPPRKPVTPPANSIPIPPQKPVAPGSSGPHPRDRFRLPPPWLRDPRAVQFIREILTEEGEYSNRPKSQDRGGETMRGVSIDRLKSWHRRNPGQAGTGPGQIPTDIKKLTADHVIRIYKEDFYDPFRIAEIEDQRLAHQLTDIAINSSPQGFRHIINGALNEVMGRHDMFEEQTRPLAAGILREDINTKARSWYMNPSAYGDSTIERLNDLVRAGFGSELKNAIVRHRHDYVKPFDEYKDNAGWVDRIERFLEWPNPLPRGR